MARPTFSERQRRRQREETRMLALEHERDQLVPLMQELMKQIKQLQSHVIRATQTMIKLSQEGPTEREREAVKKDFQINKGGKR